MRRALVSVFCLLAAAGCKREATAPAPTITPLNVYIWTNYVAPAAIARFEAAQHAKVVIDTYDNNEVIEQKLQAGGVAYDIVVPSDYMVSALVRQGLLLPLDETKLAGLSAIDPRLDWSKGHGPRHSVPYLWGTTGFAYRTDKISEPLESWSALFDARYRGRILLLDDMREVFGMALKAGGHSLNAGDDAALAGAKAKLVEQKPLVLAYDSSDFAGKLKNGDAWIAHGYSGELARAARESDKTIRYVVPKEGATLAVDNLAIPKTARHVELAYAFIAFMLDPAVAAETTNATGYATANAAAKPQIKPEIAGDPAVFPGPEVLARCETLTDLGTQLPKLDELWTELKAR